MMTEKKILRCAIYTRVTTLLIDRVVTRSDGIDIEYRADGFEAIIDDLQRKLNANQERRSA